MDEDVETDRHSHKKSHSSDLPMTLSDISHARLLNQQITGSTFGSARELVYHMGAMQAQDYPMAKWAIGVRLPGSTQELIEKAIDQGEIIRTHVLRPTWHLVAAEDVHGMLSLTAPHIKARMKSRLNELEITEKLISQSYVKIEKALAGKCHLTRDELTAELIKDGIAIDSTRSAHLMMRAELDGIICSGVSKGKKPTYALMAERVPMKKVLSQEESLAQLAQRYFSSHGPATLQDFAWWSGLSVGLAKQALELVKTEFLSETVGPHTYWLSNSFSFPKTWNRSTRLLPAFDEFIISYKDRSMSLAFHHHSKTVSSNGIFRPVIVENGQVTGLWSRTVKKDKVVIKTKLFGSSSPASRNQIEKAARALGEFLRLKTEVIFG
jgi:hypothetical protein